MRGKKVFLTLFAGVLLMAIGCNTFSIENRGKLSIQKKYFGRMADGKPIYSYTLANANGMRVTLTDFGCVVTSIIVPDRNGHLDDVTLGYDTLDEYVYAAGGHFGATVGRYANRIGKGKFTLDGKEYSLATNNGPNHLHGGIVAFDNVPWDAEPIQGEEEVSVKLTYLSVDGEEGYPGNLSCVVTFSLNNENELKIEYEAETDAPTIVNFTQHAYFNLAGHDQGDILGHELMLNADHYTPVDSGSIPTGEIRAVKGTPMDFTTPMTIGSRMGQVEGGYDHNY